MTLLAPLILYQVETQRPKNDLWDLEQLKDIGGLLRTVPFQTQFRPDYTGDRTKFLLPEPDGAVRVYREKAALERPTLLSLLKRHGPHGVGFLVPDIDVFLDCDPELAAALAMAIRSMSIQVMSIRAIFQVKDQHSGRNRREDRNKLNSRRLTEILAKENGQLDLYPIAGNCMDKAELKFRQMTSDVSSPLFGRSSRRRWTDLTEFLERPSSPECPTREFPEFRRKR